MNVKKVKFLAIGNLAIFSLLVVQLTFLTSHASAATNYNFTNASATGSSGPTQSQVTTAYTSTNLAGQVTINVQGVQEWVVPTSGTYNITVAGAAGGSNLVTPITGGYGAVLTTQVTLIQGQRLAIVVGQKGTDTPAVNTICGSYCGAAGGGGSFVYESSTTNYLAVAGGGGGAASISANLFSTQTSAHGKYDTTTGTTITINSGGTIKAFGGTLGSGGFASNRDGVSHSNSGAPGAGILSNGETLGGGEGKSRSNNWLGGNWSVTPNLVGGFGGGGAAGSPSGSYLWAGGGGGYSGGGSGGNGGAGDGQYGGGGGSYYTGTLQSGSTGTNTGQGYVTISLISALSPAGISIALGNGTKNTKKLLNTVINSVSDSAGTLTFYANGRAIPRCTNVVAPSTNYSCNWKPITTGPVSLKVSINPSGGSYSANTSSVLGVTVTKR